MAHLRSSSEFPRKRLLALMCCVLTLTTTFDSVVITQILDGSLYVESSDASLTEWEDAVEQDDEMFRPPADPDLRREVRKQDRSLPGFVGVDAEPGPLLLRTLCRFHTSLHHAGSEHAYRNGCGFPLLC